LLLAVAAVPVAFMQQVAAVLVVIVQAVCH
jgi:hypothetical protein